MLERHAVHGKPGEDSHVEAANFHVLHEQRPDSLRVVHVDARDAASVARKDLDVRNGSLVVRVESDAYRAGVSLAGMERDVADGVSVVRVVSDARVEHRARRVRVVVSVGIVLEHEVRSAHAFALEDCPPVGIFFLFRLGPAELPGNQVGPVRQIDDVVSVRMLVERPLDYLRDIGLAVGLGAIRGLRDVNDPGTMRKLDLRKQGCKWQEKNERKQSEHGKPRKGISAYNIDFLLKKIALFSADGAWENKNALREAGRKAVPDSVTCRVPRSLSSAARARPCGRADGFPLPRRRDSRVGCP